MATVALTLAAVPFSAIGTLSHAAVIPAPTGWPAPTIELGVDHAEPGDPIMVSGVASSTGPASLVRLAWLFDGAMMIGADVPVGAGDLYTTTLTVPEEAVAGPARLCAALADVEPAEFTCADFTVDPASPGAIEGTLPGGVSSGGAVASGAALAIVNPFANALMNVVDPLGNVAGSVAPASDGSFQLTGIPPGNYSLVASGVLPVGVRSTTIKVVRRSTAKKIIKPIGKPTRYDCIIDDTWIVPDALSVGPSAKVPDNASFGLYVSGVETVVSIAAQRHSIFQKQRFVGTPPPPDLPVTFDYIITKPDLSTIRIVGNPTTSLASFDVGTLPPGISTLTIVPRLNGAECANLKAHRTLKVIENPLAQVGLSDQGQITFHRIAGGSYYELDAVIPRFPNLLPFLFPNPPPDLPLLGPFRNELDAGVHVNARLRQDGTLTFHVLDAYAEIQLAGQSVFNEYVSLQQSGIGEPRLNIENLRRASFAVPRIRLIQLGPYRVTPYAGPVFSVWGIVTVNAGLSVGISGDLGFEAIVVPLVPAARARILPSVAPEIGVRVWVDLLLLVAAGADGRAQVRLTLPLHADVDPERPGPPDIALEDPCIAFGVSANIWIRLGIGWFSKTFSGPDIDIILPDGPIEIGNCDSLAVASAGLKSIYSATSSTASEPAGGDPLLHPRVLASPAAATSADGDVLEVHVEDAAASGLASPRILARFRDPGTGDWAPATPLTDGAHMVADPVAAFMGAGPGRRAIVAWTETPITPAEDSALGEDVAGFQNRQEIYYATWQAGAWSTPVPLTSDLNSDGRASIAGDGTGATLAWVRDTDGDFTTRSDWRIAVSEWADPMGFPGFELLGYSPPPGCCPTDTSACHCSAYADCTGACAQYDCRRYGDVCSVGAECCDNIPCISGRCRVP